jgi:hypothetical protein
MINWHVLFHQDWAMRKLVVVLVTSGTSNLCVWHARNSQHVYRLYCQHAQGYKGYHAGGCVSCSSTMQL